MWKDPCLPVTPCTIHNDALLEVGETWGYTAQHTVTQAEIDGNGGGDGFLENTATVNSNETGPDTDDASVPVYRNPMLNISKDATVPGGTADAAGEKISYVITVQNQGNTTLTGVAVTDPYADLGSIVRGDDVVGDNDALTSISSSLWDMETSGLSGSAGGAGLTTDEMMDPKMLALNGFASDPNWVLDAGRDYPRLAWEDTPGQSL